MKTLPPFAPKTPLNGRSNYVDNAKNYGPAPKGWRWREVGETYGIGDLCASGTFWYELKHPSEIMKSMYPIITKIKVSVKRDPKGRFASKAPKTVDLGSGFILFHGSYYKVACEHNLSAINAVLAGPEGSYGALTRCFGWSLTPQGSAYWADRNSGKSRLSPSDLDYLRAAKEFFEKRIVELTPPKPASAPSPTVPELQAKILSLEAEVRDLKRKMAGAKVTFPE